MLIINKLQHFRIFNLQNKKKKRENFQIIFISNEKQKKIVQIKILKFFKNVFNR